LGSRFGNRKIFIVEIYYKSRKQNIVSVKVELPNR